MTEEKIEEPCFVCAVQKKLIPPVPRSDYIETTYLIGYQHGMAMTLGGQAPRLCDNHGCLLSMFVATIVCNMVSAAPEPKPEPPTPKEALS